MPAGISRSSLLSRWTDPGGVDGMHFVVTAEAIEPFRLRLVFDEGLQKVVDVGDLLHGPVFEQLRDRQRFAEVTVDPVIGTVVWPNGADISPEFLYEAPPVATRTNRAVAPAASRT